MTCLLSSFRYAIMKKCWEMEPDNRPSFKELHTTTSQYIEQIAGYLDLGFNPFTEEKCTIKEEKDDVDHLQDVTLASEQSVN